MPAKAWYNENDPAAAHVLRCMIADGVIADGIVDERSIVDIECVPPGFAQYHFFAGGGLWSVAARIAGWHDERPIWTASCPCQPFSQAGEGEGFDDPRHLWPHVYRIIRTARARGYGTAVLVGEQVANKAGYAWFDRVKSDLAAENYFARVVDFPACAVNAPNKRNRQYFACVSGELANSHGRNEFSRKSRFAFGPTGQDDTQGFAISGSEFANDHGRGALALPAGIGWQMARDTERLFSPLGDTKYTGLERFGRYGDRKRGTVAFGSIAAANGSGNYWFDAEWIICHDGKARRTKPGIRFLVNGLPGRVDLWRIAGNAINPQAAAQVIAALMDVLP